MFTSNMIQDVESTHHEHGRSELDLLIELERDEKGPTKEEERIARSQFLALCWALFVVGWTSGSTGPLLPRIQNFFEVCWVGLFFWPFFQPHIEGGIRNSVLGICFAMYSQWCFVGSWYYMVTLTPCSGINSGCIAQHVVEWETRFREGELLDTLFHPQISE